MNYIERYKKRVQIQGSSYQERIENTLATDFEIFKRRSPNRVEVFYQNSTFDAVYENKQKRSIQGEESITSVLLADKYHLLNKGDFFSIEDPAINDFQTWVVLRRENRVLRGYYRYNILYLENELSYLVNGKIEKVPAYITGSKNNKLKEYFIISDEDVVNLPHKYLSVIIRADKTLSSDSKFVIGDEVWQYVDADKISIPGLYYMTLEKVTRDNYDDDIKNQIAQLHKQGEFEICATVQKPIILQSNVDTVNFYLLKNGRINKDNELSFSYNKSLIEKTDSGFKIKKAGIASITVKMGNLSQVFPISGLETKQDNLEIVYPSVIRLSLPSRIQFQDCLNYEIAYDKNKLKIDVKDNEIIATGLALGETEIVISKGNIKRILNIKIQNLWVE